MAYTTPSLLSRNYRIPMHEPVRHPRNSISVAEFLGQYYNPDDLDAFFKLMGVREWGTRPKLSLIGENLPMAGSVHSLIFNTSHLWLQMFQPSFGVCLPLSLQHVKSPSWTG